MNKRIYTEDEIQEYYERGKQDGKVELQKQLLELLGVTQLLEDELGFYELREC